MRFDEDPDDEQPGPDRLLPPEDRLWRHPSEIAAAHQGTTGPPSDPNSSARPSGAPGPGGPRRSPALAALAGACLAGVVVAVGAMWIARPTRVVEGDGATSSARATVTAATPTYVAGPVPTEALADRFGPSVARLEIEQGDRRTTATALWIDDRGTLATAATLVTGATALAVVGEDGEVQPATLLGVDDVTGVASLAVERTAGTPVTVEPSPVAAGAQAAVVGASGTEAPDGAMVPTMAAVVIRSRELRATVGRLVLHDSVELDRAVPADVTGGALVDADGHLLAMIVGNSEERGLGTTVSADQVTTSALDLREHGKVQRAWLGVRAVDLELDRAGELGVEGGAVLTEVTPESPAAGAGLEAGDVITRVDDTPVDDASDLVNTLADREPGDETTVTYLRRAAPQAVTLTLAG